MRASEAVYLVARREVTERVRERSFLIGTVVTIVIIVAVVLIPQLFDDDDGTATVGLVGAGAEPYAEALPGAAPAFELEVEIERLDDVAAAEAALEDGEVDAVVVEGDELLTSAAPGETVVALAQSVAQQLNAIRELDAVGVPPQEAVALLAADPLDVRDPSGEQEQGLGFGFGFILVVVLFGQIFGIGYAVGAGIVEEKATRVVEILLATVRPGHLLAGKIIGIGLVGLLQLVIIAAVGLAVTVGTGLVELPDAAGSAVAQGFAWFILGYAFYACAFAAIAARVPRQEELQNAMGPVTFLVFGGYILGFAAINDPSSTAAVIGTYLPPFAPLVVPARAGVVTGVETALAVAITVLAAAGLVVLASRVYAGAVLRTGSKVKLLQALRAGR